MWPFSSRRRPKDYRPELLLQQLEDRVVLDAAVNPTPQDNPSNNPANPQDHLNPTDTPAKTLGWDAGPTGGAGLVTTLPDSYQQVFNNDLAVVLVANNLADVETISNAAPDDSKVIVYDAQHDNLATITTMLQDLVSVTGHKIDNLAIVGHGTEGSLNVGTDQIQFFSLANHKETFEALGQTLSQDAQIQLYGCYVAEDDFGQALIDRVAIYTTADVFASIDSTGGAQHDWALEYSSDPYTSMEILLSPDKLTGIESELGFWMVKDINPVRLVRTCFGGCRDGQRRGDHLLHCR